VRVGTALSASAHAALWVTGLASVGLAHVSWLAALTGALLSALEFVHFKRRAAWLRRAVVARAAETARRLGFTPVARRRRRRTRWLARVPSVLFGFFV
jgi:hypothetical protein